MNCTLESIGNITLPNIAQDLLYIYPEAIHQLSQNSTLNINSEYIYIYSKNVSDSALILNAMYILSLYFKNSTMGIDNYLRCYNGSTHYTEIAINLGRLKWYPTSNKAFQYSISYIYFILFICILF
jgi:hypothetical protein